MWRRCLSGQKDKNMNENLDKLTDKQKVYAVLSTTEMTQAEKASIMGFDRRNAPVLEKRIEKKLGVKVKDMRKYDLTSSFFVNPALKSLKRLIKGEPVGTVKEVKDSTVLSAVKMVVDRHQPAVKQAHVTYDSVLTPKVIDVEATDVVDE
jgi:hypothetical protein